MRKTVFAGLVMATLVAGIATSAAAAFIPELRPFAGAFIPTGTQRDDLADALFVGGQGGVEVTPNFHLIGTVGYGARRTTKDVSLWQYDAGVETFRPWDLSDRWQLKPFLGAGLGGRTYVDGARGDHSETVFSAYAALGTELQMERLAFRIEGRDYLTRFKGLDGNMPAENRNDVTVMSGLSIHW